MKKILLGILIGLGLMAVTAYASNNFWDDGNYTHVQRFQDGDINCYVLASGTFNAPIGISCVNWKTVIQH